MEIERKVQLEKLVRDTYNISPINIVPISVGVGGETYKVETIKKNGPESGKVQGKGIEQVQGIVKDSNSYVLKFVQQEAQSAQNHPELEPGICRRLAEQGVGVPQYNQNLQGEFITKNVDGRVFHLQTYIEGEHYQPHTAPKWLMAESAKTLGKIHVALGEYQLLPVGIGEEFFQYMTPENALKSYQNSLYEVQRLGEEDIIADLEFRIRLMEHFPKYEFDVSTLTYCNTHGDYTINQLVCRDQKIVGVVDWTCACRHPVVWELVRSFVYAEPSCRKGQINIEQLIQYVRDYQSIYLLNSYDLENLLKVYYVQIAVCDYYSQYLNAPEHEKTEYLWQARFATSMLRFLSTHLEEYQEILQHSLTP